MAIRQILYLPDPALKTVCDPVDSVTPEIQALMDDLLETMYDDNGIGLSANQVGVLKRVLVMDVPKGAWKYTGEDADGILHVGSARRGDDIAEETDEEVDTHNVIMMANPEIIEASEQKSAYLEGCLSVPGQFADVVRPAKVKVRYLDRDGKTQEQEFEGLDSHCVQHEIDHLNGVVFIDHLSRLKRSTLVRKLEKYKKSHNLD